LLLNHPKNTPVPKSSGVPTAVDVMALGGAPNWNLPNEALDA
jgi:hypothetical protein